MATNSFQMTVIPSIPQDLLCGLEGHLLMAIMGNEEDGNNTRYFYADGDANQMVDVDDDLIALVESGTGTTAETLKALDLENFNGDEIDLSEHGIDFTDIFLSLVQQHPDTLPRVEIQGCWHSSKMRPGEFGGFAHIITPEGVQSIDTMQWLSQLNNGN